jgi:hypothetical protein
LDDGRIGSIFNFAVAGSRIYYSWRGRRDLCHSNGNQEKRKKAVISTKLASNPAKIESEKPHNLKEQPVKV